MLAVSGLIIIHPTLDITTNKTPAGYYFSFIGISKHPFKDKRSSHKINIFVPKEKFKIAENLLIKSQMIFIRHGDLDGHQPIANSTIFSSIQTRWNSIEILTKTFRKEKQ